MKTAFEVQQQINQQNATCESIVSVCRTENREPDTEEQAALDTFYGGDGTGGEMERLKATLKSRTNMESKAKAAADIQLGGQIRQRHNVMSQALVPAKAKRHGNLKCFENTAEGELEAYISGQWIASKLFNRDKATRWLKENGIMAQQDETAGTGLELVPEPLEAAILKRLEFLAPVLQQVRVSTMTSQTLKIPNRLAGLTVFYPDENVAITPSHETFSTISLACRKMATLTQISSELAEDAVVSIVDEVASDASYQIALKTLDDMFNGDGTATYGSVSGLVSIDANSVVTGGGVSSDLFTLADYEAVMALNPMFAGNVPQWYMNSAVWSNSVLPLLNAAGGTPGSEMVAGWAPRLFGYPVNFIQVMDTGATISTNQVYFGDLAQTVNYGTRRGLSIATSTEYGFNTDSIHVRAIQRNAITVANHDATVAGPVTAIATAAI